MSETPSQPQSSWPAAPSGGWPSAPGYSAPPPAPVAPRKSRAWLWWTLAGAFVLFGVLVVWGGFAAYHRFQGAGKTEITQLHDEMRANDLAGIFANSDPAFQRDVSRKRSDALFQYVADNLGEPLSYTVYNVQMNTTNHVSTKELILKTHFTKADGTESLTFRKDESGTWRLLKYDIRSAALTGKDFVPPKDDADQGASGEKNP